MATPRIETQRLLLRGFTAKDEQFVIQWLMDEDFMVYSPSGALDEVSAKVRFEQLKRVVTSDEFGKLAVTVKSDSRLIGYCGIERCLLNGKHELELGFRLVKSMRKQGYATEAAVALLDYYKNRGITDIVAFTEPHNIESINVLRKLSFTAAGSSVYQNMPVTIFRR